MCVGVYVCMRMYVCSLWLWPVLVGAYPVVGVRALVHSHVRM